MALQPNANPGFVPTDAQVIVVFVSASPECSGGDDCTTLSDPAAQAAQLLALAPHASIGAFVSLHADTCDPGDARFAIFADATRCAEVATVCDGLIYPEDSLPQTERIFTLEEPPADADWSNVLVERRPLGAIDFEVLPQVAALPGTGWVAPSAQGINAGASIKVSPSRPGDTFRVTVFYEQEGQPLGAP